MTLRFKSLRVEHPVPLPVEVQKMLIRVSSKFQDAKWPVMHGETGATYSGSGYSPLVRSIFFPPYESLIQREKRVRRTPDDKPLWWLGGK